MKPATLSAIIETAHSAHPESIVVFSLVMGEKIFTDLRSVSVDMETGIVRGKSNDEPVRDLFAECEHVIAVMTEARGEERRSFQRHKAQTRTRQ